MTILQLLYIIMQTGSPVYIIPCNGNYRDDTQLHNKPIVNKGKINTIIFITLK